jgi:hypothetical protein
LRDLIFNDWNDALTQKTVDEARAAGSVSVDAGFTSNDFSLQASATSWGLDAFVTAKLGS